VAQAEVICMPYATLLHKSTRESMRIPLKGNVVLVDEAHNLIEAINAVHTAMLSLQAVRASPLHVLCCNDPPLLPVLPLSHRPIPQTNQMSRALGQVALYWERYSARLSGKNAFYVQQILRILRGLVDFVRRKVAQAQAAQAAASEAQEKGETEDGGGNSGGSVVLSVNSLLFEAGIDNVNLFKVVRYMEGSQISKKVLGFAERRLAEVRRRIYAVCVCLLSCCLSFRPLMYIYTHDTRRCKSTISPLLPLPPLLAALVGTRARRGRRTEPST